MAGHVDRTNRIILALVGTVVLAVAGIGLARSLGWLSGFPPTQPLVPPVATTATADEDWWVRPTIGMVALVVALLCVRWLWAQTQRDRPRRVEVDANHHGGETWLRTSALAEAVEHEIEGFPGVVRARMNPMEGAGRARHHLVVTLSDRADVDAVRTRITQTTVPNLRRALDFAPPHVDVELVLAPREGRQLA